MGSPGGRLRATTAVMGCRIDDGMRRALVIMWIGALRRRGMVPGAGDVVIAVLLMVSAEYFASQTEDFGPTHAVMIALLTLPLALRGVFPMATAVAIEVAVLVNDSLGFTNGLFDGLFEALALLIAVYTMVARVPWSRRLLAVVAAGCAGVPIVVAIGWHNAGQVTMSDLPYKALVFGAPIALGYSMRTRRAYIGELERHAVWLAREATFEERNRIAREIHDVVAHSVSVMVMQATAAGRVGARDPAEAVGSFRTIENTGRAALADLRRVVGVLRSGRGESELVPQPGMDQLNALVDEVRRAGMTVDIRIHGTQVPLTDGIGLTAYRIAQESLTNVMKHANAQHAEVDVTYEPGRLILVISDDGDGAHAAQSGGQGLAGMRERAQLYGGTVHAEGRARGYRVVATLPLGRA